MSNFLNLEQFNAKVKTVKTMANADVKICFIAKKGKRYLTSDRGLIVPCSKMSDALAFKTESELLHFFDVCSVDSKNRMVLGDSYNTVQLSLAGG